METWGAGRRALGGVLWAIGLGLLAGAFEMIALAASERVALGLGGFALLGVTNALLVGLLAALFGVVTAPIHAATRHAWASTAMALHLTAVGWLLCGFYLWQGAWTVYTDERAVGALALALMPFGFAGVIYFNSRFFLRRMEIERPIPLPWLPTAGGAALVLVLLAATFYGFRSTGGEYGVEGELNGLLVTVDGWDPATAAPALPGATAFTDTVSPAPNAPSAAATALTGLHPLRHRVLFGDTPLSYSFVSVAELAQSEAFATGAFVSASSVHADSGLEQGFAVYDDDFSPAIPGLLRLSLVKLLTAGVDFSRSGEATVTAFEPWLADKADKPFLAWIHLPAEDADTQLERIDAALAEHGLRDATLLIAAGTRGPTSTGLSDAAVHVPMFVRVPGAEVRHTAIPQQLRLMDVAETLNERVVGIRSFETEGSDLTAYIEGRSAATLWTALVGRDAQGVLFGLRNNGVKYVKRWDTGTEQLFDLRSDPAEQTDILAEQPKTAEGARIMLASEQVRLEGLL